MVLVLGTKPDTAAVIKPKSSSLRLLFRYFEPFLLPDPLDTLVIHTPAFMTQDGCDSAVAVASIHAREFNNPLCERHLIVTHTRQVPLRCPWLFQEFARPPLGDREAIEDRFDRFSLPTRD